MNCTAVQIRLSAFLDGELAGFEMLAIREHLGRCPCCAAEAESLRTLKSLLGAVPEPEPSSEFENRLVSHVFAHAYPARSRTRAILPLALAAALTVSLIAAFALRGPLPEPLQAPLEAKRSAPYDLEIQSDQAFSAGRDPLRSSPPIIPTSYGQR